MASVKSSGSDNKSLRDHPSGPCAAVDFLRRSACRHLSLVILSYDCWGPGSHAIWKKVERGSHCSSGVLRWRSHLALHSAWTWQTSLQAALQIFPAELFDRLQNLQHLQATFYPHMWLWGWRDLHYQPVLQAKNWQVHQRWWKHRRARLRQPWLERYRQGHWLATLQVWQSLWTLYWDASLCCFSLWQWVQVEGIFQTTLLLRELLGKSR